MKKLIDFKDAVDAMNEMARVLEMAEKTNQEQDLGLTPQMLKQCTKVSTASISGGHGK